MPLPLNPATPTTFCVQPDLAASVLSGIGYTSGVGQSYIDLRAGDGVQFGTPTSTAPMRIVLVAASAVNAYLQNINRALFGVYKVTGRTTDRLTGLAFDGSGTDQNFAPGDYVGPYVVAKAFTDIHGAVNTLETSLGKAAAPSFAGLSVSPVAAGFTGPLPQSQVIPTGAVSTSATPVELFTDGAATRLVLADNTAYALQFFITARRTDTPGQIAVYRRSGIAYRASGAGSVVYHADTDDDVSIGLPAWSLAVSGDAVNGSVDLIFTGAGGATVHLGGSIRVDLIS